VSTATVTRALALLLTTLLTASAEQSENHVLQAVPSPSAVVVDGDLAEWDRSGAIVVCRDVANQLGRYSADVAMMYDADALYVGVEWRDPTPMVNNYDPRFDVDLRYCFHSDSIQLHFRTDQERKVIGWYYTRGGVPGVNVLDGWFPWDGKPIGYIDGIAKLGITQAFRPAADGRGYTQELRIPWRAIVASGKPYTAGSSFECMLDLVWGPDSGKGWPVNHMMDLVAPGAAHAGWFWEVNRIYGQVHLAPAGKLNLPEPDFLVRGRQSRAHLQPTEGPMKLGYTMPFDGYATLVIEDADGGRVRNLIGMAPRGKGRQEDCWDGLDDRGTLVTPGRYRYRGLLHAGIKPVYEATYGTPGVPPWETADGTGAWMSDHCPPRAVAAGGSTIVMGAERAEAGSSLIAVGIDGRKRWGDSGLAGVHALAADKTYAYVCLRAWDIAPALARVDLVTGQYAPFATAAGPRLKVSLETPGRPTPWISGFAAGPDRLAITLTDTNGLSVVRFYDKQSAAVLDEKPLPRPGCLAYDSQGRLYAWSSGTVVRLDATWTVHVQDAPPWASGMAFDATGRLFVADRGTHQVRVYDAIGAYVRSIGRPGGRPARGSWQADGMLNPAAVAVDADGRVWVAEESSTPKRVSVWQVDGTLVCDFLGPTGYGGTGANADPGDKTRVFGSGCEYTLDYAANRSRIVAALGDVSGRLITFKGREYIMNKGGRLYLRSGDGLRPVAAIGNPYVKDLGDWKDIPLPAAPRGTHGYASLSFVWSDRNDDGVAQTNEVAVGSGWTGWTALKYPVGTSGYFGSPWLDEACAIRSIAGESYGAHGGRPPMITRTPLKGWTAGGAPIWDLAQQRLVSEGRVQGCLYAAAEGITVAGAPLSGVADDGRILWTYPDAWPGVHASHHALLPDRDDVLVGTLGSIGQVQTPVGTVFGLHANMGRFYLMTLDGLFLASVFQDCRLGGDAWPTEARPGAPLDGVTMGSEWFGGHFFKTTRKDEYFLIAGFTAYNMIRLNGFDSLRAIRGGELRVSAADLAAAQALAERRAAPRAERREWPIARATVSPTVDGVLDDYRKDSFVEWSSGPQRVRAALACDATRLFLAYDVSGDDNPMVNKGRDINQLFATGDSVDLQLGADPKADTNRTAAALGDLRLLISVFEERPVAVLYRWRTEGDKRPVTFACPWRSHTVDRVDVIDDASVKIIRRAGGYTLEASVPVASLAWAAAPGQVYPLDAGVIFSDAKGDNRASRVYWSNKATGLVADIPGEIMPAPQLWGKGRVDP
jgi:hypothetical protein